MSKEKGKKGEDLAWEFLEKQGYQLVARNYRFQRGEIDLIVQKADLLVFVEVKLRKNTDFGTPETTLNTKQKTLILKTAENYIVENQWQFDIRFDVLAIIDNDNQLEISHFEDAFF